MAWVVVIRLATMSSMAAFFGVVAWGFSSKRDEGRFADQEATRVGVPRNKLDKSCKGSGLCLACTKLERFKRPTLF